MYYSCTFSESKMWVRDGDDGHILDHRSSTNHSDCPYSCGSLPLTGTGPYQRCLPAIHQRKSLNIMYWI